MEPGTDPGNDSSEDDDDEGMWGSLGDEPSQDWDLEGNLQHPAPSGSFDHDNCTTVSNNAKETANTFVTQLASQFYAADSASLLLSKCIA